MIGFKIVFVIRFLWEVISILDFYYFERVKCFCILYIIYNLDIVEVRINLGLFIILRIIICMMFSNLCGIIMLKR